MRNFKVIATVPLLLAIYGCSSSDSTPAGGTATPLTTSGLFQDVEVKSLDFTTASGVSGQTDQYGAYDYVAGEDITFSIGGVTLGTVAGAPGITPFDFGLASTNIARFIQSLDADDDPTNGIDLTAASAALAGTVISSDAFLADKATFEANTQITDAITLAGKILIAEATAVANLTAGTDSTFDTAELEDKVFVLIDHVNNAVGLLAFEASNVFSVLSTDTTTAGEDGIGGDDIWSVDLISGVLTLQDVPGGSTTVINRIGSSTEAISVTVSEDGAPLLPATFVFPEAVTAVDLGGDGSIITSKTYDVVDQNGAPISVTFSFDGINGTYEAIENSIVVENGTFLADTPAPGITTLIDDADTTKITLMIVMDGDATVVNETATILLAVAKLIGISTPSDPDFIFNEIGLGSVTLK